jgi:hypothetical protein
VSPPEPGASLPLSRRKLDLVILVFFWFNLLFVTYMIDLEQLVIADPYDFEYPLWPPGWMVDLVHWWGANFDPPLMARPAWWLATIWIDALFFGPFYLFGIYAFTRGRDWIRFPAIVYASVMLTNVTVILGEEFFGAHATEHPWLVLAVNAPWLVVPVLILCRMARAERPFA